MQSSYIYQPTPLEQAYSLYLAQQVFGIAPGNPVYISGRDAVPFLTQSGLDRGILRSIWTAADPECIGTLTQLSQLHLLLRLVSMGQFGMLDPQSQTDALLGWVQQCASQQLQLPTFSSVAILPQDQLMNMYGSYIVYNNSMQGSQQSMPIATGINDSFGAPLGNSFNTTAPPPIGMPGPTLSIDDAFGELVEVEDAPLPSLDQFTTQKVMSDVEPDANEQEDDDFGGFEGANADGADNLSPPASIGDVFSEEVASTSETVPQEGPDQAFDDLQDGTSTNNVGSDDAQQEGQAITEIQPNPEIPPTSLFDQTAVISAMRADSMEVNINGNSSDDPFSAFDSISAPAQPELPSLSKNNVVPTDGDGTQQSPVTDDNVEGQQFGEFGEAPQTNVETSGASLPAGNLNISMGLDQGGAVLPEKLGVETAHSAEPDDLFSAFDSVAPPLDLPLPSLPSMDSQNEITVPSSDANNTDDEFGEFGEASNSQQNVNASNNFFSAPDPAQQNNSQEEDMFGDFGAITTPANNNAEFGRFEQVPPTAGISEGLGNIDLAQSGSQEHDMFGDFGGATSPADNNAFGGFEEVPPTTGNSEDLGNIDLATSGSQEHDMFGDFGGATTTLVGLDTSTPVQPNNEEDDMFGDFGGSTTPTNDNADFGSFEQVPPTTTAAPPNNEEKDIFGDFGDATKTTDDSADFGKFEQEVASSGFLGAAPKKPTDQEEDMFGDFGGATKPAEDVPDFGNFEQVPPTTSDGPDIAATHSANQEEDLFGDFGGTPKPAEDDSDFGNFEQVPPTTSTHAQSTNEDKDSVGDFGGATKPAEDNADFGSFEQVQPTASEPAPSTNQDEDLFGDFGGASKSAEDNSDFGNFEQVPPTAPQSTNQEEDLFGDFGGVARNEPAVAEQHGESNEADDDWGDFENVTPKAAPEESFGDFGGASGSQQIEDTPGVDAFVGASSKDDLDFGNFEDAPVTSTSGQVADDDDWGAFENGTENAAPDESFGNFSDANTSVWMLNQIRALSSQLPQAILRKGRSGEHVDLGECFEVNIGSDFDQDDQRQKRAARCLRVMELLSKSHSKLASAYWEQVFNVIHDELVLGKSLFLEARNLSSNDLKTAQRPLQTMFAGITEYIRVTRSIVATIGDLLMLEASALLTIDTWASTWCSLSILEKALEIEKLWKEIQQEYSTVFSVKPENNVEGIRLEKIRERVISGSLASNKLCHLTLQPLADQDKNSSQAEVVWQDKNFMACSANFLAHRCPFYVSSVTDHSG